MTGQTTRYRVGPYYNQSRPVGGWIISPWTGEIEVSADGTQWRYVGSGAIWRTFCRRNNGGLPLAELITQGFWARVEPDLPDEMKVSEGL